MRPYLIVKGRTGKKTSIFVLLSSGQVQYKLKFVDSLQIMTSTSSYTLQSCFED